MPKHRMNFSPDFTFYKKTAIFKVVSRSQASAQFVESPVALEDDKDISLHITVVPCKAHKSHKIVDSI